MELRRIGGSIMTTPMHAPPGQPWNATAVYDVPVDRPRPTIAVNPQYSSSTLFHQTFLKGKPKPLGIVLVVGGILEIVLGITSIFTGAVFSLISGIDFWGGIINIVAGSLTISAGIRPNICMIKGSLSLNIIAAFFTFIAIILVCVDLNLISIVDQSLESYDFSGGIAVLAILVLVNFLLFSLSISVSVFGCKALGQESNTPAQVFVVQNGVTVAMPHPPSYENY